MKPAVYTLRQHPSNYNRQPTSSFSEYHTSHLKTTYNKGS